MSKPSECVGRWETTKPPGPINDMGKAPASCHTADSESSPRLTAIAEKAAEARTIDRVAADNRRFFERQFALPGTSNVLI